MIHHRLYRWLFGAALVSVTVFHVTRSTLAQAPSRAPKVIYFSRPETADAAENDVVRETVESPQQSNGSHEAVASTRIPALDGTAILNDSPPSPSSPVVIRFGQSTPSNTRQAAGALGIVDARPVLSRAVDTRPVVPRLSVGDGPLRIPQNTSALRVVDHAPPGAISGDFASVSKLETNSSVLAAESAVGDLTDSEAPQLLTEVANVSATSHTAWKPTARTRNTPPSALHRVVEFATTSRTRAEEAETTQSMIDDRNGSAATGSNGNLTTVWRPGSEVSEASSDSPPRRFLMPVVTHVTADDSEPSSSVATIPFAPTALLRNDHLMVILIGGFVLLLSGLFCMVIFTLTMIGRQREPMLKVDINNNGPGAGTAGSEPAHSQTVTMNDSRPVDHNNPLKRVPAYVKPAAPADSPPAPQGYSRSVAQAYSQSVARTKNG